MEPDFSEQESNPQVDSSIEIIRIVLCMIFIPIVLLVIFFSLGYTQGALVTTFQRTGNACQLMLQDAQKLFLPKQH